jgi:3-hydroxyisobutyrate dehydrogenase-like beta-hydroxyacid dehydrogenase
MSQEIRICLLGFGEVGQTLAEDLLSFEIAAWDIRFSDTLSSPFLALKVHSLAPFRDAVSAVEGANIVISAVTAAQSLAAAQSVLPGLSRGALFVDLNSASPSVKQTTGKCVEAAGARYVEAVVMSPIANRRIASPVLLGGPHAHAFLPMAKLLGFVGASVFSATIGPASATKMCRSVIIKGMEALLTESLLAARHYHVEETVLASLNDFFPGHDWPELSRYMISRGLLHGTRRAEEMLEAAYTVSEAGIEPLMSLACAQRQDWSARYASALDRTDLGDMLDGIRQEAEREKEKPRQC